MSTHCLIRRPIVAGVSSGAYPSLLMVGYLDISACPTNLAVEVNADKSRGSFSRGSSLRHRPYRMLVPEPRGVADPAGEFDDQRAVAKVALCCCLMLSTPLRYSFWLRFSSGNFSSRFIYHGVMSPSWLCDVFIIKFPS